MCSSDLSSGPHKANGRGLSGGVEAVAVAAGAAIVTAIAARVAIGIDRLSSLLGSRAMALTHEFLSSAAGLARRRSCFHEAFRATLSHVRFQSA